MDIRNCFKYDDDGIITDCPKCSSSSKYFNSSNSAESKRRLDKMSTKLDVSNYVTQIVSTGIRPDNVYEAKMYLSPEVDLSSIKITVKGNNLRVNVCKPFNDQFAKHLPDISERSVLGDLVKRTMRHAENLLIPEGIDSAKVRAVMDNKHRMLVLTAPTLKSSKARKSIEKS